LRVSEATGADIDRLGLERGHRTLTILRKGGKIVTIPLAPRTAMAIDLAIGERLDGPIFLGPDVRTTMRDDRARVTLDRQSPTSSPPFRAGAARRPATGVWVPPGPRCPTAKRPVCANWSWRGFELDPAQIVYSAACLPSVGTEPHGAGYGGRPRSSP